MNEETSVLKKVGIVAAVATAGVLALSPLAFAQGNGNGDGDRDRGGNSSTGFSFEDNSVERNQVNLCSFDQEYNGEPGGLIPGILPLVSQDQNYNCVNVGDRSDYTAPAELLPPLLPPPGVPTLVPGL
jgi:hypothetical protein